MRRRHIKTAVTVAAILLLMIVFVYSGLRLLESTVLQSADQTEEPVASKTVVLDGVPYFPRQDVDIYLLMGIDRFGPVEDSGSYNNDGEADTIIVLLFDRADETVSVLALNRDTMTDMPVLGVGGRQAGTAYGQLALSHTYGSGLKDSCENTCRTVEDLLNIEIDHYVSMNMDGIALLNDAVGGVSVDVKDDFSQADPSIPMGETVLKGSQAISFVRMRMDVGDQLNVSRMDRQQEYIKGFLNSLQLQLQADSTFGAKLYEEAADYLVTDCSATVLSAAMEEYAEYSLKEIMTPAGENRQGEMYMEFYPDEAELEKLVLRMFYAPKK